MLALHVFFRSFNSDSGISAIGIGAYCFAKLFIQRRAADQKPKSRS